MGAETCRSVIVQKERERKRKKPRTTHHHWDAGGASRAGREAIQQCDDRRTNVIRVLATNVILCLRLRTTNVQTALGQRWQLPT